MELGSWFQLLICRWQLWGPRSHRRHPAPRLAHIHLRHTVTFCRKSKPQELARPMAEWAIGFFLSTPVQHLSPHNEEELPLGKRKKQKSPSSSQETARSFYIFCHVKTWGGAIITGYLPKAMPPFQREPERTWPQNGVFNFNFVWV